MLALRYLELYVEKADQDIMITSIFDGLASKLVKRKAVGYECASKLLISMDNIPQRLKSESAFSALCSVSPDRHFSENKLARI